MFWRGDEIRKPTCLSDEWGTPKKHFNKWDAEFNFTLDPCGNKNIPLKDNILTLDIRNGEDGLKYDWSGHRVFVNPPYSANNVYLWCRKCFNELERAEVIVLLIPVSKASASYFHKYIYPHATIRLLKGRLKFVPLQGQKQSSNPQGSMLCIMRSKSNNNQTALYNQP